MGTHGQQCSGAFSLVRDDDSQFSTTSLRRTGNTNGYFTIASWCVKHQMEVLRGVCVEYQLLKVCNTPRSDYVGYHYEAGLMGFLIFLDERLALVPV